MLDVAYLLCNSARAEQLCDGKDRELVSCYIEELAAARERQRSSHAAGPGSRAATAYSLERGWREYRLAVADYARFLAGWCLGAHSSGSRRRRTIWKSSRRRRRKKK